MRAEHEEGMGLDPKKKRQETTWRAEYEEGLGKTMHHVLCPLEYSQLHMFMSLGNLDLPHWNGLRASRLRIRKLLKMDIDFKESVLHNPCYVINLKQIIAQVS